MVSALRTKLYREIWRMRVEVASIAALIATSVAVFVTLFCTEQSLLAARDAYYESTAFADVFAELRRAPRAVEAQIRAILGVSQVEVRDVAEVRLEVQGFAEPVVGRLISVPRSGASRLNRTVLRRGRGIDPTHPDEVLVNESFAVAHKLGPGDTLAAVIDGRRATLRVAGVALSPEFVFAVRAGEIVPDERRYGVVWMNEDGLGRALDLDGAFNSVALELAPGANDRAVMTRLDAILAPYGGLGAYARRDQSSHRSLMAKLDQIAVQARIMPAIFLGVAAFLLNTVLARLIGTQRPIIATLRAFGFSRRAIIAHYLELATVIVAIGVVLGLAWSAWLGVRLINLYRPYYQFPALKFQMEPGAVLVGVGVSLGASLGGVLSAVLRAAALAPAEAMRPEAPKTFRPLRIERVIGPLLSPSARMVLRQLGRRPGRAALGAFGITFAVAIIVTTGFFSDSIDELVDVQFFRRAREDATVIFREPLSHGAVHELTRLPGVLRVEPVRDAPVRLIAGTRSRSTVVEGLAPGGQLHPLLDASFREVVLPEGGLLLTRRLGEVLGVGRGDEVMVELLSGTREKRLLRVAGLCDELIGISAYMDQGALGRLVGDPGSVTSAYLALDASAAEDAVRRLSAMPNVSSVGLRLTVVKLFRDEITGRMMIMTVVLAAFAALIAASVVYNGARIALAERLHELGCMRVMGFTRREVATLLLSELGLQVVVAIPIGWLLGHSLAAAMSKSVATDAYRFPLVIEPHTYAWAAIVVTVAAALSALGVRQRIAAIDLGEVLRTRE
jgi:putative ABC transport system permease protein